MTTQRPTVEDVTTLGAKPEGGATGRTRWQLTSYFLKLGTIGFGGPVALVGSMQRDLVERHR